MKRKLIAKFLNFAKSQEEFEEPREQPVSPGRRSGGIGTHEEFHKLLYHLQEVYLK